MREGEGTRRFNYQDGVESEEEEQQYLHENRSRHLKP
jgi:hypothetical protein